MTAFEKLEALYATLPTVECKRKCQAYCGGILISKIEAARLEEKRGFLEKVTAFEADKRPYLPTPAIIESEFIGLRPSLTMECVFLMGNHCLAYKIRPLVCRIWGCVDNEFMRCEFGCIPSRWLTNREVKQLHMDVIQIQKEWQAEGNNP